LAIVAARCGAGPACQLPLRLRRQPVTLLLQRSRRQTHARAVPVVLVGQVTPFFLRDPLLIAQPVAVSGRVEPADDVDRAIPRRPSRLLRLLPAEARKL